MLKSFRAVLLGLMAILLASCAGGRSTTPEEEKDGLSFSAKPNMARLYLIHGMTKNTEPHPVLSGLFMAGVVGGVVAAIDQNSPIPPGPYDPTDPENRHRHSDEDVREEYYVNDQKIGNIQVGQYIALDLAPGHYAVKAIRVNVSKREVLDNISVDIVVGQVVYLYSSVSVGTFYHDSQIVWCDEKCQQLVISGHRIIVEAAR